VEPSAGNVVQDALNIHHAVFLFLVSAPGSGLNAVAGEGSFIAFPALLFTGVPPIPPGATNTFALWVGVKGSGGACRSRLNISRRVMAPLIVMSVAGGLAGALLLILAGLNMTIYFFVRAD
jgi:uncharacterized membrane protein YfcA